MKKLIFALLLTLSLIFTLSSAFAADTTIEELEYMGFGILKLEFRNDVNWYPDASFTVTGTDVFAPELSVTPFAGEEEEAYLYIPELADGQSYSLRFVLGGTDQSLSFTAETGVKVRISKNGELTTKQEKERCDLCREAGHDEDFCPERINPGDIPTDADSLAWYFDIDERCERCGGFGHDEDRCRG